MRTKLFASIAAIAIAAAASPAVAKPGGGGGGGGGGAAPVGAGSGGMGSTMRDLGRINSQGPANAGSRAIERANENSVLKNGGNGGIDAEPITGTRIPDSAVRSSSRADSRADTRGSSSASASAKLTGVVSGMTVVDSSGATIGTVTGIRTTGNGSAKSVQITLESGQVITVDGRSLSLSDGVLTANTLTSNVNSQGAAHASINGLVHASPNSALSTAGVTTLTGLTTGLTVNSTGGESMGTVSGILTNRSGAVVGINVSLEGGGTVTIPATTLSMDGTTVVTSFDLDQ